DIRVEPEYVAVTEPAPGKLDEVAGLDRQRGDGLTSINVQPNVNALEAQTKVASHAADCHRPGRTQEPSLRAEQRRGDRRRRKLRNEESARVSAAAPPESGGDRNVRGGVRSRRCCPGAGTPGAGGAGDAGQGAGGRSTRDQKRSERRATERELDCDSS